MSPAGGLVPVASNLNFAAGQTIANLVTVQVGRRRQVDLTNHSGGRQRGRRRRRLLRAPASATCFTAVDARPGSSTPERAPAATRPVGPAPDRAASRSPASARSRPPPPPWSSTSPSPTPPPRAGSRVSPTGTAPAPRLQPQLHRRSDHPQPRHRQSRHRRRHRPHQRLSGHVDVIADVVGYYTPHSGVALRPAGPGPDPGHPHRDRRLQRTPWGPAETRPLAVAGVGGVPAPTPPPWSSTSPSPTPAPRAGSPSAPPAPHRPLASNLNFTAGQTIPNLVIVKVGTDGKIDLTNLPATVHVIADVVGYYTNT